LNTPATVPASTVPAAIPAPVATAPRPGALAVPIPSVPPASAKAGVALKDVSSNNGAVSLEFNSISSNSICSGSKGTSSKPSQFSFMKWTSSEPQAIVTGKHLSVLLLL
jgi:hypothetical protein